MSHKFVHVELSSRDDAETRKFYSSVFGWTFQDFSEMNYTTFSPGEDELGGGLTQVSEGIPAGTVIAYIETDDREGTMAKILANGGTEVFERLDIPGVGKMGYFKDPTGNLLAVLQPSEEMG